MNHSSSKNSKVNLKTLKESFKQINKEKNFKKKSYLNTETMNHEIISS